jgi:hypothetical protein
MSRLQRPGKSLDVVFLKLICPNFRHLGRELERLDIGEKRDSEVGDSHFNLGVELK